MIQKATEAYKLWHGFHNAFPRLTKFSLGGKIDTLFCELMENLFLARYATRDNKQAFIGTASLKLDLLKFFIRIAWEIEVLDHKRFAAMLAPLNDIGNMIGGWQKQS